MYNIGMFYGGGSRYIKKEDAPYFVRQQYLIVSLLYFICLLILLILYFLVVPKITVMYADFMIPLHPAIRFLPLGLIFICLFFLKQTYYFFTKKVDESELRQKLRQYKKGEMILANKVLDMKKSYLAILLMSFCLIYFGASIITAIYGLAYKL